LGAHLLLRRTRRIGVYFARNGLARFCCLIGVELFVRSATSKGNNPTSEENETPAFHPEINNRRVLDFQRRCNYIGRRPRQIDNSSRVARQRRIGKLCDARLTEFAPSRSEARESFRCLHSKFGKGHC